MIRTLALAMTVMAIVAATAQAQLIEKKALTLDEPNGSPRRQKPKRRLKEREW